jgi:uncharacterized protein
MKKRVPGADETGAPEQLEAASGARARERRGGFAANPELARQAGRKGGIEAHRRGTAHRWSTAEARAAGSKGGAKSRGGGRPRKQAVGAEPTS